MYVTTTEGVVIPLSHITAISESEINSEAFMQYKLSCDINNTYEHVFVRTALGEFHEILLTDNNNQQSIKPTEMMHEYVGVDSIKKFLYTRWSELCELGVIKPFKIRD